jgi:nicotinate-nucleotide--dimethylbenzimidazole phosphoribosyltransferase
MNNIFEIKIEDIDFSIFDTVQKKIDKLAMPLGSLGVLHELAKRVVGITRNLNPSFDKFSILIFAGDHGITQRGVSAYTHKITYYNALNMLIGRSTINAFANNIGANVIVVDNGIDANSIMEKPLYPNIQFYDLKVNRGTCDCSVMPAMTTDEVIKGIKNGYNVTKSIINNNDVIGIGEMGIGNTSIASLLTSFLLDIPIEEVTGPGSGLNKIGVKNKTNSLKKVLNRISYISKIDIIRVLSEIGGHEINGMIGAVLCAAEHKKPILVDGIISSSAALAASFINKNVNNYLIFCTQSTEPGHLHIYNYFSQTPILNLGLRLGEGTGVALAYPIIKAAMTQLKDIAELEDISIDKPNPEGFMSKWNNNQTYPIFKFIEDNNCFQKANKKLSITRLQHNN